MDRQTLAMHIKATRHRIEYWREAAKEAAPGSEIEKLCRRMIEQHEKRLNRLIAKEVAMDGTGAGD